MEEPAEHPAEEGEKQLSGKEEPPAEGGAEEPAGETKPPIEGGSEEPAGGKEEPLTEGGSEEPAGETKPPTEGGSEEPAGGKEEPLTEGGSEEPAGETKPPVEGGSEEPAGGKEEAAPSGGEEPATGGGEVAADATPLSATGEDFAGEPSDVLLTYSEPVTPSVASPCVAVDAGGAVEEFGGSAQGPSSESVRLYLAPEAQMPAEVRCPSETNVTKAEAMVQTSEPNVLAVSPPAPTSGGVVHDPIDPKYLTELPFGARSFWIQPWRAYMDTWPASRLVDSLGINFNVNAKQAEDTAQLLQESGFKLARVEIGWNSLTYEDPAKFKNEASIDEKLQALRKHGLRPLILLNANSGEPNPAKAVTLETTAEAPAGARTVTLSATSAAQVVPGKTGFDNLSFGGTPDLLIASISGDVATLAKPLAKALAAGAHKGATMLYAPFGPPELANGAPNPVFQETLNGWLSYVGTICKKAASIFGPEGYDLEVWNELSFGSQYLNEEKYYSPARESGEGSVEKALLDETVAYIRNPANGIAAGVGVTNGFASETPYASGANQPAGTTAISKHLYASRRYFPSDETDNAIKPLNALGENEYSTSGTASNRIYTPLFQPDFKAELPEYYLTGLQTETVTRDLAPLTTELNGIPHGRNTAPEGSPPPQVWMTEYNLQHTGLIAEQEGHPDEFAAAVTPSQAEHLQAEIALRSLVAMINKGMTREYFYAATGEGWNLISEAFMKAVTANPTSYPGSALGGETTASFARMMARLQGPGPEGPARQLTLRSIAQEGNHAQFVGDGTLGAPSLYDRELLAVLPFQASPTKFVIPVYVMTENLTTITKPQEPPTSIYRFDLPNENFRITVGNLPATSTPPTVRAYDPIRGENTPASLLARRGTEAVFEVAATDYPRLLEVEYPTA